MNEKVGMDYDEFEIYITNSIAPLFKYEKYVLWKRFIINIDSWPGQTNIELLEKLRNLGFLLYPGVTNTTSVSQETYHNYGPFKTIFRKKLYMLTASLIA